MSCTSHYDDIAAAAGSAQGAGAPILGATSAGTMPGGTSTTNLGGTSTTTGGAAATTTTGGASAGSPPVMAVPLPAGYAVSPANLGIELSNYETSSNVPMFLQHLGVNEVRQFPAFLPGTMTLKQFLGAAYGVDVHGKPVTNGAEFVAAAAELHDTVNPLSVSSSLSFVLSETRRLHLNYLAQLFLSSATFAFSTYDTAQADYWQERFGFYTYIYNVGRLLLPQGVTYFETENEPDLNLPSAASTIDHMILTSQAIRAAAADDPSQPQVKIFGPVLVTTGVPIGSGSWLPAILAKMRTSIPAGQSTVPIVDFLAYHRYGRDGAYYASMAEAFKAAMAEDNLDLPLAITEYSTSTSRGMDPTPSSSDDPSYASNFLSQTSAMLDKVAFVSAFTMGMRIAPGYVCGIAKNGIHWMDAAEDSVLHNIGGPTRSGEAFALIARHFTGSKPLYKITSAPSWVTTADAEHVYILSVNNTASTVTTKASLAALPSALKVAANTPCFVDGVSATAYGHTVQNVTLDAELGLTLNQPAYSTWLVTVPRDHGGASLTSLALQHDNVLLAGSDTPVHNQQTLRVAATTRAEDDTSVAALQFAPLVQPATWVGLRLTVASSDPVNVILHVYGFKRIGADGENLTWTNSGLMNVVDPNTQVNDISDNLLAYQAAPSPSYLGSLFVPASSKNLPLTLNVTDFANDNSGPTIYVIIREFLNNGTLNRQPGPDVLAQSTVTFAGGMAVDVSQKPALLVLP